MQKMQSCQADREVLCCHRSRNETSSALSDANRLAVKRGLAERKGRSMECGMALKRGKGAEPNGEIYVKAHVQAGGLPGAESRSTGGRPSSAVDNHSFSKTIVARKRKGVDEEGQKAELWPDKKQVKMERNGAKVQSPYQSRGGVPAPTAHPGPTPAPTEQFQTSKLRARG